MKSLSTGHQSFQMDTLLTHLGRAPAEHAGMVNVPVYRGSTILSETLEEWDAKKVGGNPMASYGRFGSPLTRALEDAVCALEGGHQSALFPSGLSACTHTLMGLVKAGDHILIADCVYGPTRVFADRVLGRMHVEVEYFDPNSIEDYKSKMKDNTTVVYLEAPGSLTFEMQDVPLVSRIAHKNGAFVVMDNTWATPIFFKAIEKGVDVSIQSATKYIIGHSDALLGIATANARAWSALKASAHEFGETAGPDDVYLALRGLRTLGVRMKQHWHNGVRLAQSLQAHPAVRQVLHPAVPGCPGHDLWQRDFTGASGLFGVVLNPMSRAQLSTVFRTLKLFGIGLSWGGYESLALLVEQLPRSCAQFDPSFPILRLHAGLEDADDLIEDMNTALMAGWLDHGQPNAAEEKRFA